MRADIKLQAATTCRSTQQIISEATSNLRPSEAVKLPEERVLKRVVQKARRQVRNFPVEPSNLHELVIPMEYRQLDNETPFLLHDSGPRNDRICVFATQRNLEIMSQSETFSQMERLAQFQGTSFNSCTQFIFYILAR